MADKLPNLMLHHTHNMNSLKFIYATNDSIHVLAKFTITLRLLMFCSIESHPFLPIRLSHAIPSLFPPFTSSIWSRSHNLFLMVQVPLVDFATFDAVMSMKTHAHANARKSRAKRKKRKLIVFEAHTYDINTATHYTYVEDLESI